MIQTLKRLPILLFIFIVFTKGQRRPDTLCDKVTVSARGQQIQIRHSGCPWVRIEYSTTDWQCRGNNCAQKGTVTWHDVRIDTRNKDRIFYFEAARGPKSVSFVQEASVLDCGCQ
jgi:hypothetical protein